VLKNSTGYNLTQLIVGSEGTLGIVTKIVLKLLPHPKHDLLMLVPFSNLEKAGEAVSAIFRAGFTPSALELVEIDALKIVSKMMDSIAVPVNDGIAAHLIIEVDGNHIETLMSEMEAIAELLTQFDCGEIFFADDEITTPCGRSCKVSRLYNRRGYGSTKGIAASPYTWSKRIGPAV
jgi:glycolate oxidase